MAIKSEQLIKTYLTVENDTWDLIAFKIFGDEKYTSHLLKVNPELSRVVFFPANIALIVPEIPEDNIGGLPEWITK